MQDKNNNPIVKKLLFDINKSFCMYPWVHLHTSPIGVAAPCCIAKSCATVDGVGNSREQGLMELVNSEKMKKLRLDMLAGEKNSECSKCHMHEEQGVLSARKFANLEFGNYLDEVLENTNLETGALSKFTMRYFDVRFSNICNFKCRTCGSEFSTQWEQEDLKNKVWNAKVLPKNDNKNFLKDVIEQIDYMQVAYFAGGEPLITEEHYILLEEMIRRKRTNIRLRYNTNLSNLKFKNKDLLQLWHHFDNKIDIYASIDHYGERAEYIRHGTDWGVVETNFLAAQAKPFIDLQINTVLSVFNFLTIYDFYKYLIDKKMYSPNSRIYTLYNMSTPEHLACHILPEEYKVQGKESIEKTISLFTNLNFTIGHIDQVKSALPWIMSKNSWEDEKIRFREEVKRLDRIRNENFQTTFPELAGLMRPDKRKIFPV